MACTSVCTVAPGLANGVAQGPVDRIVDFLGKGMGVEDRTPCDRHFNVPRAH